MLGGEGLIGGFADFTINLGFEGFNFFLIEKAFANEEERKLGERVATGFGFALFRSLIELFVVGKRVGVGTRDAGVNKCGAAALASVGDGFLADGVAFQRVGAVAFGDVQAGKTFDQPGNAATGGLHFDGNGDGVTVVLDEIEKGSFLAQATLSDSQNSPSLVAPSPEET